jgi:hypothetical protein
MSSHSRTFRIGQLTYKVEIGRRLASMVISHKKLFPSKVRQVVPKLGITHFFKYCSYLVTKKMRIQDQLGYKSAQTTHFLPEREHLLHYENRSHKHIQVYT